MANSKVAAVFMKIQCLLRHALTIFELEYWSRAIQTEDAHAAGSVFPRAAVSIGEKTPIGAYPQSPTASFALRSYPTGDFFAPGCQSANRDFAFFVDAGIAFELGIIGKHARTSVGTHFPFTSDLDIGKHQGGDGFVAQLRGDLEFWPLRSGLHSKPRTAVPHARWNTSAYERRYQMRLPKLLGLFLVGGSSVVQCLAQVKAENAAADGDEHQQRQGCGNRRSPTRDCARHQRPGSLQAGGGGGGDARQRSGCGPVHQEATQIFRQVCGALA